MTYRYLLDQGLSKEEALMGAIHEGHDLLDYNRHGSHVGTLTRLVPFLNAAIQGADRSARGLVGELRKRLSAAHVLPAQGVAAVWPEAEKRLLGDRDRARLHDLIVRAKGPSLH